MSNGEDLKLVLKFIDRLEDDVYRSYQGETLDSVLNELNKVQSYVEYLKDKEKFNELE